MTQAPKPIDTPPPVDLTDLSDLPREVEGMMRAGHREAASWAMVERHGISLKDAEAAIGLWVARQG